MSSRIALAAVLGVALLFSTAATTQAGTVAGMWHMDETSGTTMFDSSGNNNNGTLTDVTLGLPGVSGTAYGFNGTTSYAKIPPSASLNPGSSDVTLSAYVKFTGPFLDDSYDLVRKGLSTTAGGEYKMEILDSGELHCVFKGSAGTVRVEYEPSQPILGDGQWHNVKCIKGDATVTAMVDGQSTTRSGAAGSISNSSAVFIGAKNAGDDVYNGALDEVSIEFSTPVGPNCLGQASTIVGTSGADTLTGTPGADVIFGAGGNDTIDGGGGDDLVCGDFGLDQLSGGEGNDRLSGGSGQDTISDSTGTDVLEGNGGNDSLNAADGGTGDIAKGGPGTDGCTVDPGDTVNGCETT